MEREHPRSLGPGATCGPAAASWGRWSCQVGPCGPAVAQPPARTFERLIAQGLTNREIGGELHLAEKTVKNSVPDLLTELDMQRRTEAAVSSTQVSQDTQRHKD